MSSDERQEAIWDIILQRKFETVPNIADELGVCTRTIYGDVTKMRKKYPIEPISGNMAVFILYISRIMQQCI